MRNEYPVLKKTKIVKHKFLLIVLLITLCFHQIGAQSQPKSTASINLPVRYFQLLESGISRIEKRLNDEPGATLASLEAQPGWSHFPSAILMPAVLYTKSHPANKAFGNTSFLSLAKRIGDLLAIEYNKGNYTARGDNDWDTYMWL